jgi:hypothetical protein
MEEEKIIIWLPKVATWKALVGSCTLGWKDVEVVWNFALGWRSFAPRRWKENLQWSVWRTCGRRKGLNWKLNECSGIRSAQNLKCDSLKWSGNNYDAKEKCEKEKLEMKEEAHRKRCNETWRYEST